MSQDPFTDALVDKMYDAQAKEFQATFALKHQLLVQTTEVFRKRIEQCRRDGFHTHETLWNVCFYINLVSHDLSLLVQDLSVHREDWHRRFIARHLALLLYESTEDVRSLLGKAFREALNTLGLLANFSDQLKSARKPLDEFWDTYQDTFKEIRLVSAAHRDHDALKTLAIIQSIDIHGFIGHGLAFNNILNGITATLQKILNDSSLVMPPEL